MKSCDKITADLLKRRDIYKKEQRKKRKRALSSALCFCLVAALGFGAWQMMQSDVKDKDESPVCEKSNSAESEECLSARKEPLFPAEDSEDLSSLPWLKPEDFVKSKTANSTECNNSVIDMAKHYMSAEQLITDKTAALIIEGEVLSSEFVNLSSETLNPGMLVPNTKSIVRINSVFKGDKKPGDEICVAEIGGFVPAKLAYDLIVKDKFPDSPEYSGPEDAVEEYRTMGYKPCEKGERVILILSELKWKQYAENNAFYVSEGESVYSPMNAVQGKYLMQKGKRVEYKGKAMKSDDVYVMYTNKDFEYFPDKMFTLKDFKKFCEKTFNKLG